MTEQGTDKRDPSEILSILEALRRVAHLANDLRTAKKDIANGTHWLSDRKTELFRNGPKDAWSQHEILRGLLPQAIQAALDVRAGLYKFADFRDTKEKWRQDIGRLRSELEALRRLAYEYPTAADLEAGRLALTEIWHMSRRVHHLWQAKSGERRRLLSQPWPNQTPRVSAIIGGNEPKEATEVESPKRLGDCQTPEELSAVIAQHLKNGGMRRYSRDAAGFERIEYDDFETRRLYGTALDSYARIRKSHPKLSPLQIVTSDPLSGLAQIQQLCEDKGRSSQGEITAGPSNNKPTKDEHTVVQPAQRRIRKTPMESVPALDRLIAQSEKEFEGLRRCDPKVYAEAVDFIVLSGPDDDWDDPHRWHWHIHTFRIRRKQPWTVTSCAWNVPRNKRAVGSYAALASEYQSLGDFVHICEVASKRLLLRAQADRTEPAIPYELPSYWLDAASDIRKRPNGAVDEHSQWHIWFEFVWKCAQQPGCGIIGRTERKNGKTWRYFESDFCTASLEALAYLRLAPTLPTASGTLTKTSAEECPSPGDTGENGIKKLTRPPKQSDEMPQRTNWITVSNAATLSGLNRGIISRAVTGREIVSNGKTGRARRLDSADFNRWQLARAGKPDTAETDAQVERQFAKNQGR